MRINKIPNMKVITVIVVAQPGTACFITNLAYSACSIRTNDKKLVPKPNRIPSLSGIIEKEVIPAVAIFNIFFKL